MMIKRARTPGIGALAAVDFKAAATTGRSVRCATRKLIHEVVTAPNTMPAAMRLATAAPASRLTNPNTTPLTVQVANCTAL
jgi:hypothetical protein